MIKLIFRDNSFSKLSSSLLDSKLESCAIALAREVDVNGDKRLLVSEIIIAPEQAYSSRTNVFSELKPDFLVAIVKRARTDNKSVIFCHTHPGDFHKPAFSPIDDDGESKLSPFLEDRVPGVTHAALVISQGGCRARKLGLKTEIEVIEIGQDRKTLSKIDDESISINTNYDRQIRAFGSQGQKIIDQLKIGIVGLGGTGSVVSTELALLGVNNFLLIDPDNVEATNLNRLFGASYRDIGLAKANVSKEAINHINPKAKIESIKGDVTDKITAESLLGCDFIFCCTDSHASRAVINQIAYQYYIPVIDMGVSISTNDGEVTHITGRVQMLSPGLGCLICGNILDGNAIRREMMNQVQREADPYFLNASGEPQPAVVSLNGTISSLAITMFLGAVTNIPAKARLQFYDGIKGAIRSALQTKNPSCIVCSENGALGVGHSWPLPVKNNAK